VVLQLGALLLLGRGWGVNVPVLLIKVSALLAAV
jgi:hypothetical protein